MTDSVTRVCMRSPMIGAPPNIRDSPPHNINHFKKIKESQPTNRLPSLKDKYTIILEKDIIRRTWWKIRTMQTPTWPNRKSLQQANQFITKTSMRPPREAAPQWLPSTLEYKGKPMALERETTEDIEEADKRRIQMIMSKKWWRTTEKLVTSEIRKERYLIQIELNLNGRHNTRRKNSSEGTISIGGRIEWKCTLWKDLSLLSIAHSTWYITTIVEMEQMLSALSEWSPNDSY